MITKQREFVPAKCARIKSVRSEYKLGFWVRFFSEGEMVLCLSKSKSQKHVTQKVSSCRC